MTKKAIVIGSGFAGLSAATFLAAAGWSVTVLEKQSTPGGRARRYQEQGFTFDMGPSWYWMPDVFERYFAAFGKKVSDYYTLHRLDPSYRVYWNDAQTDLPASLSQLKALFENLEPGSSIQLDRFLKEAAYKYETGMQQLVYKPGRSLTEFIDWKVIKGLFRLDLLNSIRSHINKYFKHPKLRQLLEFPVLFLGALPERTPALYSLMNYADIVGGTWHPQGGMYRIVEGMHQLAIEKGVEFRFNENVSSVAISNGRVSEVVTDKGTYQADVVVGGADYHFIETSLLPPEYRSYSDQYWDSRELAPSCLLYYVGISKKLPGIQHHNLFFDTDFEQHAAEIYKRPQWPSDPLFYVCAPSVTDSSAAPAGCENLFFLIPVAAGLKGDDETLRESYFQQILKRFEKHTGHAVADAIVLKKSFAITDFVHEYNAFKGNAYGLANTLRQTAMLKPSCRSKKLSNLFYTGQLTVPGPGVPPSLISGEVVAREVLKYY